ncbi:MAG TPA: hypothetical protein DHN33_01215, partial [Eubacteriaceae bacterium]|nr:hypothetical protein [Eubacteriaceae bacterium]
DEHFGSFLFEVSFYTIIRTLSSYIEVTNQVVKEVSETTLVMQAAGISTKDDVYRVICLGADGTGATSGIVEDENPRQALIDMIEAVVRGCQK